jgi:hypothetical protein
LFVYLKKGIKLMVAKKYADVFKSLEEKVKCYCPLCEDYYYRQLVWTGNGTPRMFCPKHVQRIETITGPDVNDELPFKATVSVPED